MVRADRDDMYHWLRSAFIVACSCSFNSLPFALSSIWGMRDRTVFSADFLMTYSLRSSNASPTPSGALRNSWAMYGMRALAHSPIASGLTGTLRHPSGLTSWLVADASNASIQNFLS